MLSNNKKEEFVIINNEKEKLLNVLKALNYKYTENENDIVIKF